MNEKYCTKYRQEMQLIHHLLYRCHFDYYYINFFYKKEKELLSMNDAKKTKDDIINQH